jgi:hypothetical protein
MLKPMRAMKKTSDVEVKLMLLWILAKGRPVTKQHHLRRGIMAITPSASSHHHHQHRRIITISIVT